MGLKRYALAAAAGMAAGHYLSGTRRRPGTASAARTFDGLSATFRTREEATLAVEHLVQEYGIEPSFIYVDPVNGENTAGVVPSGGDHASGAPGDGDRSDGPFAGEIELTVPTTGNSASKLRAALEEAGATRIVEF